MWDGEAILRGRLANLERMLAKRRDMPGFAANVAAIEAQIAEIEAALSEA